MTIRFPYVPISRRHDSVNEAIVVHCSDHRFQRGFREFLVDGLGLTHFALMAIPGGGHFASMRQRRPEAYAVQIQSLAFLVRRTNARRIILLGHDDCLFFNDQLQLDSEKADLQHKQIASLDRATQVLKGSFPEAVIELYFADADSTGALSFVRV